MGVYNSEGWAMFYTAALLPLKEREQNSPMAEIRKELRDLSGQYHTCPDGKRRKISLRTWIRRYKRMTGDFRNQMRKQRKDKSVPRSLIGLKLQSEKEVVMVKAHPLEQNIYPFAETPTKPFIYKGPQWENIFRHLNETISRYHLALLIGLAGCGKTLMLESLCNLQYANRQIFIVRLAHLNGYSLLCEIGQLIGIQKVWGSKQLLYNAIHDHIATKKNKVVIAIDDAHLLSSNVIIDIAMLHNYILPTGRLTLILCGKHPVIDTLYLAQHQDFQAKIRKHYCMPQFSEKETCDFIDYQLSAAKSNMVFKSEVKEQIHHLSAGIVRNINNICDACICQANELNINIVDNDLFNIVLKNLKIRR